MTDRAKVWVLGDLDDALDQVLVELLASRLQDVASVELRDPARPTEAGATVGERLRAFVSDGLGDGGDRLAGMLSEPDPPTVVVTATPDHVVALAEIARRGGPLPVRVGISREPALGPAWAAAPTHLLAVADDRVKQAAPGQASDARVTGMAVPAGFALPTDAPGLRKDAQIAADAHVVLVPAGAVSPGDRSQLLVQLGLVRADLDVLFEVDDATEAEELRRLAPIHGIGACLVPTGEGSSRFWSLAHVILGRPQALDFARARAVGVPLLALPPQSARERRFADGLVRSGTGRTVESLATLAVDMDLTLEPDRYESLARLQRELAIEGPGDRLGALVLEAIDRARELTASGSGLPTGLERISSRSKKGPGPADGFDEAARAATEVRDRADMWSQRARIARSRGEEDLSQEAEKRAAHHRDALTRLLERLRPEDWADAKEEPELEEELEALRRRAKPDRNVEERLRSLEVDDELRALKERLDRE